MPVTKNPQNIRSRCLVNEFSMAAFYYEKVRRMMHTAIVYYLLKSPCPHLLLYVFPLHFHLKTNVVIRSTFRSTIPSLITTLLLDLQNVCSNSFVSVKGFKATFSIVTCISLFRFLKCFVTLLPLYLHCITLPSIFRNSNLIQ